MPKKKLLAFGILPVMLLAGRMSAAVPAPAFSFLYDGTPSRSLLAAWEFAESRKQLDSGRTEVTRSYLDPRTGLEARCVSIEYGDFPAVEWTVYFSNRGVYGY